MSGSEVFEVSASFFFSSRRRHTRFDCDWSSDVCSSDLIKGGHAQSAHATDLLVTPSAVARFTAEKIDTQNTHGTGCTLSAAIAAGLAKGLDRESGGEGKGGDLGGRRVIKKKKKREWKAA